MPSMTLKVNITKGWPNPNILERAAAKSGSESQTLEAGKFGYLSAGAWILGTSSKLQETHVFMQDQDDPDTGRANVISDAVSVKYGSIQGISLRNPIEIETVQFVSNAGLVEGAEVSVSNAADATKGQLKLAVSTEVVVGIVNKAAYSLGGASYLTITPIAAYVK